MKNKSKLLFYKIFLAILLLAFVITIVLIVKKYGTQELYEEKNEEIVEVFSQTEEKIDEQGLSIIEFEGFKVIGIIKIPAIDLEYPILEKTTKLTMATSISRFSGGEVNEYGNISLAGHNNYSGTMFGKNKNLKLNDKILLTDLTGRTIEYEIYDIFVTDPNDTKILETKDETKREVTLITCKNGRSERLIIKAREK